jgi:hypothetical protein
MFGLFGNPSPSKFAKFVMDSAKKAGFPKEMVFDEADFSIKHGEGRLFKLLRRILRCESRAEKDPDGECGYRYVAK